LLWTQTVDPADVGKDCEVVLVTTNNESTREGSDLILQSGSSSLASNVEHDTAPQTFVGRLTLGTTITVSVRFGPEGMYSGGSDVETNCPLTEVITTPAAPEPAVEAAAEPAGAAVPVPVRPVFTG
jgi:hypothetical protein